MSRRMVKQTISWAIIGVIIAQDFWTARSIIILRKEARKTDNYHSRCKYPWLSPPGLVALSNQPSPEAADFRVQGIWETIHILWQSRVSLTNCMSASGCMFLYRTEVMTPHPDVNLNLTCSCTLVNIPAQNVCNSPISNVCLFVLISFLTLHQAMCAFFFFFSSRRCSLYKQQPQRPLS